MTDEIELARRLIAGDSSALDEFIGAFRGKVFQYSFLMCGQREDAEEVAQETLLKVFEHFNQLREPEHIRAWVFRIAKNVCSMRRRKSVFAPQEEISLDELKPNWRGDGDERRLEIADWTALPEDLAAKRQMSRLLRAAIADLPEIYKSVILLRDVEELSTQEAADILEVTEDVIKTRLHRARLAVRQKLDAALRAAQEVA
ncbi:MAG: sigma-70 family RNA polymerase sigma factor [Bryobacterales bacterium]|nr:sigma-70 family RNA polymerase sigma factor [Bryobacterales bacterium]